MKKIVITAGDKGLFEVYSYFGYFDEGVDALQKQKLELATSEELAEARVLDVRVRVDWRKSKLCVYGCWVAENYNYHPNGEILIAGKEFNPVLKQLKQSENAIRDHWNPKQFDLDARTWKELRGRAETDPEKAIESGVLLLPRKAYRPYVPTHALEEYAPTRFHFRKQAGPYAYGGFLAEQGVHKISHEVADAGYAKEQKQPFGQPLWVSGISTIFYRTPGLTSSSGYGAGWVRSIRSMPAEQDAVKRAK